MSTIYYTEGDRGPGFQATLSDADGTAIDVSARTVTFDMWDRARNAIVSAGSATQPNGGADGVVAYAWAAGDLDVSKVYRCRWTIDAGQATEESVPNDGADRVVVVRGSP